jgi:hypothetical protein
LSRPVIWGYIQSKANSMAIYKCCAVFSIGLGAITAEIFSNMKFLGQIWVSLIGMCHQNVIVNSPQSFESFLTFSNFLQCACLQNILKIKLLKIILKIFRKS